MNIQETLQQKLGKEIAQASNEEIYGALLSMVQEMAGEKERTDSKKKLYYISAIFLPFCASTSFTSLKIPRLIMLLESSFPIKNSAEI